MSESRAQFSNLQRATVVLTSITPWDEIPRLRHQVARQLARNFNVLWIRLPFHSDARWAIAASPRAVSDSVVELALPPLSRTVSRIWSREPLTRSILNRGVVQRVEQAIQKTTPRADILVNFFPWCPQLYRLPRFRVTLYVCNDDFAAQLPVLHRWHARLTEHRTVALADACLAVSHPLQQRFVQHNSRSHVFLPGVELETASHVTPPSTPRADGTTRVCFMGTLDRRLHYSWLERLVSEDPRFHLSLIGPIISDRAVKRLLSLERTEWHPPRFGQDLFEFLSRHDVLVAPYQEGMPGSGQTTAPNKLFQYLATGRPVVMAGRMHLASFPKDCLYSASSAQDFVQLVGLAHERDSAAHCAARRAVAEANSMDKRGDWLRRLIDDTAQVDGRN